ARLLAARLRELGLRLQELGLALGEELFDPGPGALGPARDAAQAQLVARIGDGHRGLAREQAHPRELARAERAAATAVVEVNDAERLAAREERHREHATEAERV